MTPEEFIQLLRTRPERVATLAARVLPVKLGNLARRHFREGFRQGGFIDAGLERWPVTRRQQSGAASAATQYGPLLSGRDRLFSSVGYETRPGAVTVFSRLPYSAIHNAGGTVHPAVTPAMRRYAWAMYYKNGGGAKGKTPSAEADRWKRLALTRKQRLDVRIPKRQFIGPSRRLEEAIHTKIGEELAALAR